MDDSPIVATGGPKGKNENKDGYTQLVEKMEQVRSQMVKMERKYDELYKTVKEREHSRLASASSDQSPTADLKTTREHVTEVNILKDFPENASPKATEQLVEEKPAGKSEIDIEKLEDNPFL